jgi:hypothetical protein
MVSKLSTGCQTIDDLMEGGFPLGAPALVYSIPNLGKTWLTFQTACMCTRDPKHGGLGRPVLYLDTESYFSEETFNRLYAYFQKRWPDLPKEPMIEIVMIPSIFELGQEFGMEIQIVQEESRTSALIKFPTDRQVKIADGKAEGKREVKETFQSTGWLKTSPAWKKFEDKNYGMMAIDSITVPLKTSIPKTTQNLPARGTILNAILGVLYPFVKHFNSSILVTDHLTRSPMNPMYQYGLGDPWGGSDIIYYIKYIVGLFPAKKDDRESIDQGYRLKQIFRYRYPGLDSKTVLAMLAQDTGYIDRPKGNVREA